MREMTMYVLSPCNLNCEECIMMKFMKKHRSYQMSLPEIEAFLDISSKSDYVFRFILSGGEPLLWKNLKAGVQLLRGSPVCGGIDMFSNAVNINKVDDDVMECIDELRLSLYGNNRKNAECLIKRYGKKIRVVDRTTFWVNPTSAIEGTLPAKCLNYHQHMYMDYKVYACPHSGSIAEGNGSKTPIYTPLAPGFLEKVDAIFESQQPEICTFCISNKNVRDKVETVSNSKGISLL